MKPPTKISRHKQAEQAALEVTNDPILQQMLSAEEMELDELDTALLWRLLHYVGPHWPLAAFATALALVEALLMTLPAWLVGLIIDNISTTQNRSGFLSQNLHQLRQYCQSFAPTSWSENESMMVFYGLVIAGSFVLRWMVAVVTVYSMQKLGQKIVHDIRVQVFTHLCAMDMSFFQKNPLGRLVNRTIFDVQGISDLFSDAFAQGIRDLLFIAVLITVMLMLDVPLALTLICAFPVLIVIALFYRSRARPYLRTTAALLSRMNAWMSENISGMRENQLYTREDRRRQEFFSLTVAHQDAMTHLIRSWAFLRPPMMMTSVIATAVVLLLGYWRVAEALVTIGVLLTFVQYTNLLWRPVRNLTEKYNLIQTSLTSAERVMNILDQQTAMQSSPTADRKHRVKHGTVSFEEVQFAYPSKPKQTILRNISFSMKPGSKLALVGDTGAGKSTIIHLISRFYDSTSGSVKIDGRDVQDYTLPNLRSGIALVPQDVVIFAGTIRDNLTMGKPVDEQVIQTALQAVCAHRIVQRFEKGLDHTFDEGGRTLSTGERQLFSFARALIANPPLLILDEATANVDTETEQIIQQALTTLTKNRSSIVIAHRLSTIRDADQILVLRHGEIIEAGNHDELMAMNGEYYRLVQLHMMHDDNRTIES